MSDSELNQERWQQVDELLQSALIRPSELRAAFLDEACTGEPDLRREVESLLIHHAQAGNFLEDSPADAAADVLAQGHPRMTKGQLIGRYKAIALLGVGGMGEVYLAEDTRLGRRVALKMLPAQFTEDHSRVKRFEQEARAVSALNHPNIVTIHEIGLADETHFIVTEFIEGQTLRQRISSVPMSVGEVIDTAIQVTSALDAAHTAGIVHRDIKPENIMLRPDGLVKVLDFGLAKLVETKKPASDSITSVGDGFSTGIGIVMGTARYMSPEQSRGQKIDARTDIWSLGVVIYEMLTGTAPFSGETPSHVIVAVLESEPQPLARYSANLPAEIERIINKAMQKNREERYQSIKDLAFDLKNIKKELSFGAQLEHPSVQHANGKSVTKSGPTDVAKSGVESLGLSIKSYKRTALASLLALMIVAAGIAYFSRGETPKESASSVPSLAGNDSNIREISGRVGKPPIDSTANLPLTMLGGTSNIQELLGRVEKSIDSIAILPFVNTGGESNTEYLSDGIPESIIMSLSSLRQLRVVSNDLVRAYKGSNSQPQTIGRELGANAVLTGTVLKNGEAINVHVALLDVMTASQLWAGNYSRKLTNLLDMQEQITKEVFQALSLHLTGEESKRLAKGRAENSEAFQLYLEGLYYFRQPTDEAHIKSGELFQQAIDKDPKFALAWAGLADYYGLMANLGQVSPNEAWPKSRDAAVKAFALDGTLGQAHTSLGAVRMWYDRDWPGAEQEFKLGIKFASDSAGSYNLYTKLLSDMGRFDEAIATTKRAHELEPDTPIARRGLTLAAIHYYARRYDQALEEYLKVPEKDRTLQMRNELANVYVKQRKFKEALAEMDKAVLLAKRPRQYAAIAYVYAAAGEQAKAIDLLDNHVKGATNLSYSIAAIYAALGLADDAFKWLESAVGEHTSDVIDLKIDPRFDSLHQDSRFPRLLGLMNITP